MLSSRETKTFLDNTPTFPDLPKVVLSMMKLPTSLRTLRSSKDVTVTMRFPLCALVMLLACALFPMGAQAGSPSKPTAAVALGDSFISGEAGRWQGNSVDPTLCRRGTDRACTLDVTGLIPTYDSSSTYLGASDANGCHRSDVSEILTAGIAVDEPINIACSGAQTPNIWRASQGGEVFKGEAPQADQLAAIAAEKNVKVVVLSIGGNDLGFADIITACIAAYATRTGPCNQAQAANVDAAMQTAMAGVGKAIDEIRAVMSGAGYSSSSYRLIVQSYPSPVPRAAENRYPEADNTRLVIGGCPFYDADLDYARDVLVKTISDNLEIVAGAKGAQFMRLTQLFQGREICATASSQSLTFPTATTSEWARFLDPGVQGDLEESLHPNRYGQRAFGDCLGLIATTNRSRDYECRNTPGLGPDQMTLTRIF